MSTGEREMQDTETKKGGEWRDVRGGDDAGASGEQNE